MSHEHQRRLELIVENTTNMVIVTNGERKIEWVNPAYTKATGWTLEEIKGKNPRSFLHGPRTSLAEASRIGSRLRKGLPVRDAEMLNYRKSGEPYWVSLSIDPILDEGGQVVEYVAIQSDITERKHREIEAARMLRTLREAQRIAKLGNMEHDLASGSVQCSEEIYRILDATGEDIDTSYESLMAYTHPDDRSLVRLNYEQAVKAGGPYESQHRVITRAGRVKWVHLHGMLERASEGDSAVCRLAVQDITERKQAEQLVREKELLDRAAKTQMETLSRISHELRTPLHALLGFADLVERAEGNSLLPSSKRGLGHIRASAQHLLLLVNDMLDLARLHDGRIPLDLQLVPLRDVVEEVLAMLEPVAARRGIALAMENRSELLLAYADRRRLIQVLINLVGNAIKYNRANGRVSVRCMALSADSVAIAVTDTGIGIAAQHLERLFEPFYRVLGPQPEDSQLDQDSTGLGLAIAKSLLHAMGGAIHAESEFGVGSTFFVTLARAEGGSSQLRQAPLGPAPSEVESGVGGTLLYIEDSAVNRVLVEAYLEARPNVTLVCSEDGRSGLAAARRLHPALILIDMRLPDMSGHEVLRAILDDPELCRIPCIAFSADTGVEDVESAIRSGFREFLPKPSSATEFLLAIDRILAVEPMASRV
ncbi:PAS domain S-box protein [Roseateles sp. DAIF2]|nr:PAS domain S-box protein [Roseateles sp. DAIF2]